jgi:hypothetical protein
LIDNFRNVYVWVWERGYDIVIVQVFVLWHERVQGVDKGLYRKYYKVWLKIIMQCDT